MLHATLPSDILDRIRHLPFVTELSYSPVAERDWGGDGRLKIKTPRGTFPLIVQMKRSYLSRLVIDQLVGWLNHVRHSQGQGVVLLARHIPRGAAQALMEAKINFADDAGNLHFELGDSYNWTVIGIPAPGPASERRPISPAQLQLLFQFASHPESVNWPVRQLQNAAGISKSKAAQARSQMIAEGLLIRAGKQCHLAGAKALADRLVPGYAQVLRPKLVLGTFRPQEEKPASFLERLRNEPTYRFALTGGPAAGLLQDFYRGPEIPLFVDARTRAIARQLRLLPDRNGPVTLLNAFGEVVYWEKRAQLMIAPPWLIYAELVSSQDPRSLEAAREFRQEYLAAA